MQTAGLSVLRNVGVDEVEADDVPRGRLIPFGDTTGGLNRGGRGRVYDGRAYHPEQTGDWEGMNRAEASGGNTLDKQVALLRCGQELLLGADTIEEVTELKKRAEEINKRLTLGLTFRWETVERRSEVTWVNPQVSAENPEVDRRDVSYWYSGIVIGRMTRWEGARSEEGEIAT